MKMKKWIAGCLSIALALGLYCPAANADASAVAQESGSDTAEVDIGTYGDYLAAHGTPTQDNSPDETIFIPASTYSSMHECSAYLSAYMGETGCLYWDEAGGTVTWDFTVEREGYYNLAIDYCAISGKNYDIVLDIYLDGQIPYTNVQNINLHRLFLDETYFSAEDNDFRTNSKGDELRPALVEQIQWQTQSVMDAKSQYTGAMYFYLTEGAHSISLALKEECFALRGLTFYQEKAITSYAQMQQQQNAEDTSGHMLTFEAEKSYIKNDITLFATYDTAYCHVTPSSATGTRYNTIGKNTWKTIGQQITWEFEVPEDGYYMLAFKVKQNTKTNAYSVRSVSIDGASLCEEMTVQKFAYRSSWYVQALQDAQGEPMRVYLSAGRHVLGMTAVIDEEMAAILRGVSEVTTELQGWYREIIKITGFNADSSRVTIDLDRDFDLDKNIPGLMEGLSTCKERLEQLYANLGELDGMNLSGASILKEMSELLEGLIKHPKKIAKRLETFRSDISTLATWAIDMQEQPLSMDKFYVYSPEYETPGVSDNAFLQFFRQIYYRIQLFLNSFSGSATAISGATPTEESDVTLRVWISTADITTTGASSGRDQAIILKKLIDESFTAQYGIRVEVSLVSGSDTLVQAVLAGEGPDVALFTSVDTPVNLAMRGMLLELSQFEGAEAVLEEFTESAVTPFYYKDGLYAFPETMSYNVLFYRSDIYEELGLTPPQTWEEFYEQIICLSNHNYMVGVPQNQNTFETFLYQSGTTFYTDDLTRSTFDTTKALEAFANWTDLYTKYSLPLTFDFFNRFRCGEMALAVMPYNQVNYLYSAAPELDGLWAMATMPGTLREDGTIDFTETSTSTGCIGLADTQYPQETFEFLKWWVSADTQAQFGIQVEQTLGIAARYGTANLKAFEQIPWSQEHAEVLRAQRDHTVAVEQIPGNYYIARNLSFAFRAVVYNKANLRETLYKYNIEINKELERKQKEFNY